MIIRYLSGSLPIKLKINFSYTNCDLNILGSIYQLRSKNFRVDGPILHSIHFTLPKKNLKISYYYVYNN